MRWCVKCGVWSVQFQVRPLERKASLGVALQHEYVRVMIVDDDSAAASQKKRTRTSLAGAARKFYGWEKPEL